MDTRILQKELAARCDLQAYLLKNSARVVRVWSGRMKGYWCDGGEGYCSSKFLANVYRLEMAYKMTEHMANENFIYFEYVDGDK